MPGSRYRGCSPTVATGFHIPGPEIIPAWVCCKCPFQALRTGIRTGAIQHLNAECCAWQRMHAHNAGFHVGKHEIEDLRGWFFGWFRSRFCCWLLSWRFCRCARRLLRRHELHDLMCCCWSRRVAGTLCSIAYCCTQATESQDNQENTASKQKLEPLRLRSKPCLIPRLIRLLSLLEIRLIVHRVSFLNLVHTD